MTAPAAATVPSTLIRLLANLTMERAEGRLDGDTWEHAFMQALSQYHLAAYAHGAGMKLRNLGPEDHKLVQAVVDRQKKFLQGFDHAFEDGRYEDRETVAAHRAKMYADAVLGTWWMGNTRGWPLPAWPADGTTQCKTNCRCAWDIQELEGEGNADAYWILGPTDHCQTCVQRAEEWSPVKIRNGDLQL